MRNYSGRKGCSAVKSCCGTVTLKATALITADLVGGAISSFTKDVPILEKLQVRC